MLSKNEIEVLACFLPKLEEKTAKEIEIKAKLSHETVFRLLKGLVREKLVREKKIGKMKIYGFDRETDFFYQVFVHFVTKKRQVFKAKHNLLFKRLLEFVKEVQPVQLVILFGSYAKGTETAKSDIDLLCVTENKYVEKIARTYQIKYGLVIRPIVIRASNFKDIKNDNIIFYNDLVEYGIILDGAEYFSKEVYK